MRKVKKHIHYLHLPFPKPGQPGVDEDMLPVGDRQALDFTMEPRTDLTQFQADP